MNELVNMSEKKKLTNNVGAPVADNQNVIMYPSFRAKKGEFFCYRLPKNLMQ